MTSPSLPIPHEPVLLLHKVKLSVVDSLHRDSRLVRRDLNPGRIRGQFVGWFPAMASTPLGSGITIHDIRYHPLPADGRGSAPWFWDGSNHRVDEAEHVFVGARGMFAHNPVVLDEQRPSYDHGYGHLYSGSNLYWGDPAPHTVSSITANTGTAITYPSLPNYLTNLTI